MRRSAGYDDGLCRRWRDFDMMDRNPGKTLAT